MASFTPQWDLKADAQYIKEGEDVLIKLSINKEGINGDTYALSPNEYLEMIVEIECIDSVGNIFDAESHYTVYVGNDETSLEPLSSGITGNTKINGRHKCKITKDNFYLPGTLNTEDVYYIKVHCIDDGTFNSTEILNFNLTSVNVMYFGNISPSGVLRNTLATLSFDSTDVWVTPGVEIGDNDDLYCIGDVEYGANSTLFVQAFGRKRVYNPGTDGVVDTSNRVYYPAYQLLDMDISEVPEKHITGEYSIFKPVPKTWPINGINKEVRVDIEDDQHNTTSSGMVFNPNGQFLQTFLYDSDARDVYFKVRIVDILSTYIDDSERFAVNQRYKAYQMWVCPENTDSIYAVNDEPKANHLYQLKDNVIYPYVINGEFEDGENKPVFNSSHWNDLGYYDVNLGSNIIGQEKLFRILINATEGSGISFTTDSDLGSIHVGEYYGQSVYPQIRVNSTNQVSYVLDGGDDIRKYGLDLTPDGFITGTAYARSTDFSANDDINLEFDILAYDTSGASAKGTFKIKIIRGLGENYLSAHVVPSVYFERDWFKCISTPSFVNQAYHRQSDERYGLRKVPRMLLKENFVDPTMPYSTLSNIKKTLRERIIDQSGNTIPTGNFKMVIGNYKVMSCLDNLGNLQYDLLYREVHPEGTQVQVSKNPRRYSNVSNGELGELFGLRQNIFDAIGEDTVNLVRDPSDLQNRGLYVDAISGLSEEMLDTVPRYMNHPYMDDGITKGFMPIIPVAYCAPGKGEAFFNTLLQNNEHGNMVGTEFEITAVEFGYHTQEYERYVPNTFKISLHNNNIGG